MDGDAQMGSVKDLVTDDSPAGQRYREPTMERLGLGAWFVKGTFSVGDLKHLIPSVEIPQKMEALAMMAGYYWEHAATVGFQNSYVGMLDADDQMTDVQTLLDRGDTSNVVVMRLAVTPHSITPGGVITSGVRDEYHRLIAAGDLATYIADCECIFRFGLPLGSSFYKRVAKAAGVEDEYEQVAKLAETVDLLDTIRSIPGILGKPEMVEVLGAMGLDHIPNPGYIGKSPYLNFDTKFCPGGDKPYTVSEAQDALHLSDLAWEG